MNTTDRPTIHYTKLPDVPPESSLALEWQVYKRELPRLLAEGQEGKAILIKGDRVLGTFDTEDAAVQAGYARYVAESFFVHTIRSQEPMVRLSPHCWPCPT
jgi:hypothetical protein